MPNETAERLAQLLINDVHRRIFDESYGRIFKCLDLLSPEEIWKRPNAELSSVGNLVLHLAGNMRQWLVHGLGGQEDVRERDQEFAQSGLSKDALKALLTDLQEEVEMVLSSLSPEELLKRKELQGLHENGVSVLIHVAEHFSYHTGQISWATKLWKEVDLGYYADLGL